MKNISKYRNPIHLITGTLLFLIISLLQIPILIIVLIAIPLGALAGKTFCSWICPIGFLMENLMFKAGGTDLAKMNMFNYHKLGCPIAWGQGLMNRISLLKIKTDKSTCVDCGKCDSSCYITSINKEYSLYDQSKRHPSAAYQCSRCLDCVSACPMGSIKLKA